MALGYVMTFGLFTIVLLLLLLRLGKRVLSPTHTVARDLAEDNVARRLQPRVWLRLLPYCQGIRRSPTSHAGRK